MNSTLHDELQLLDQYIILQLVRQVFERDVLIINTSNIKTKSPYIGFILQAVQRIHKESWNLYGDLSRTGIKIRDCKLHRGKLTIMYDFRGHRDVRQFVLIHLKTMIESEMKRYLFGFY